MSLNVNGLRDIDKLNSVFAAIKIRHANITFLQETFWNDNFIERYKHLWEVEIFYNNCPHKNRRGLAILISKECSYDFITEGRILNINVKIDNDVCSLVNAYAPNDINEKVLFFKELTNVIDSKNTIVAGDFNEIFDPSLDIGINNTTFSLRSSNALKTVLNNYNLIDIWRQESR